MTIVFHLTPSKYQGYGMLLERSQSSRVLFINQFIQNKLDCNSFKHSRTSSANQQNLPFDIIKFKQKRNYNMGSNNSMHQKVRDNQEFQSLKTTIRSSKEGYPYQHVEVEAITLEQKYMKWNNEMKNYLKIISEKLNFTNEDINCHFWLPVSKDFVSNQTYCKENKGRAVLTFQGGYTNLTQQVLERSFNNNPFTNTYLWHLLYFFSETVLLFRKSLPNFQLHSNKIMVNNYMTKIKFFTPFTQFQPFIPIRTEPYISNQKLMRRYRRVNSSLELQKKNDDFVVGMILAECMLLQSCCQIYEEGSQGKKYLSQQVLTKIINQILRISYYPLKLKLIIIGLIQFDDNDRFALCEVSQLLSSYKNKIQNFDTFHTTKTQFTQIFGAKLQNLQLYVDRLNAEASQSIFQKGLATINRSKPIKQTQIPQMIQHKIKAPFEPKDPFTPIENCTNKTQSLNFSLSHIPKVAPKGDESMSLVWSKSELKSNRQQGVISVAYSPSVSPRLKQVTKQQDDKKLSKFVKVKEEEVKIQNFQKQNIQKEVIVQDLFDPFKKQDNMKEEASQKSQQINQQPVSFTLKKTQSFIREEEINLKPQKQKAFGIERAYSQTYKIQTQKQEIESLNNNLNQSFKEIEMDKKVQETQQNDIGCSKNRQIVKNDSKPKIPLSRRLSQRRQQANKLRESSSYPTNNERLKLNQDSLSQVVEYKSYLFQSPNLQMSPISFKYEEKNPNINKEEQRDGVRIQEAEQSSIRRKQLCIQNFQSPKNRKEISRDGKHLKQTDSIINSLTNLISSKKIDLTESNKGTKQSTVVPTQSKVAQYMKSFTKFSPELIAQLNIRNNYPEDERLKLKARESLNTNNIIMSQSRQLFPLTEYPLNIEQNIKL